MLIKNIEQSLRYNPDVPRWRHRSRIEQLVVHHSETTGQTVRNINSWHIDHRGWYRISYHFVIDPKGVVYQTNQVRYMTWHAAGVNATSIGICMMGNFDHQVPPREQFEPLVELCTRLAVIHGISTDNILGHRKINPNKTCPGKKFDMDELRRRVHQWNHGSGFGYPSKV